MVSPFCTKKYVQVLVTSGWFLEVCLNIRTKYAIIHNCHSANLVTLQKKASYLHAGRVACFGPGQHMIPESCQVLNARNQQAQDPLAIQPEPKLTPEKPKVQSRCQEVWAT